MSLKSYDTLLQQVQELISEAVPGGVTITPKNVITDLSRGEVSDFGYIIQGISDALGDILESRIISGLDVTASTPPSATINITAGKGTAAGKLYELKENTSANINFTARDSLYYVVLFEERIVITTTKTNDQCTIAKIVVPRPGATSRIVDDKPKDGFDAWIVSAKDVVFDENQQFDDASIEKLRDVIGPILSENLIGNIRLSENLKIINTQGTLELDSNSVKISDLDQNVLAKFSKDGTLFYDTQHRIIGKFASDEAYIGNILITKNSIQTRNFSSGLAGFQIKDSGDVELNNGVFRGTLSANTGNIGGWTLAANELYGTTTGTIKTSINAGSGYNGVVLDIDGLRVYDDVLGEVVDLPSDGSAPTFSSGIINSTIFEIQTSAVLRTSETVGDGSANSSGILINNTGLYGCETNQILANANFKVLANGNAYFKGQIQATSGTIGGITIVGDTLTGGTIIGTTLRGGVIETSATVPKVKIDNTGVSYQVATDAGTWGSGDLWGDGSLYGSGYLACLFNENFPAFSVLSETTMADIRLYNRGDDPVAGTHALADFIVTNNDLKICTSAGSPGIFSKFLRSGSGSHYELLNIGTNTHSEIDSHLTDLDSDIVDLVVHTNNSSIHYYGQMPVFNQNLGTDHTVSGFTVWFTAGENLVFANILYLKSDGKYYKTDADAAATMPARLLATGTISSAASGTGLRLGYARDDTWNWTTTGQLLYASTTPGAITATAPSGTGDQVQLVGEAITADIIYFDPNATLIELV